MKGRGMTMRTLLSLIVACGCAHASESAVPSGQALLEAVEEQGKLDQDLRAKVVMTQTKEGQCVKQTTAEHYRRDRSGSFVLLVASPASDRGDAYLRAAGTLWMYHRTTRSFQRVDRAENICGFDARGQDFEGRKLTDVFAPAPGADGVPVAALLGDHPVWRFEVRAKILDVDCPRKVLWVSRDGNLLLKTQDYSSTGVLMQSAYFLKYARVGNGRSIPSQTMIVDELRRSERTVVDLLEIRTGKVPDAIFTRSWIESRSR